MTTNPVEQGGVVVPRAALNALRRMMRVQKDGGFIYYSLEQEVANFLHAVDAPTPAPAEGDELAPLAERALQSMADDKRSDAEWARGLVASAFGTQPEGLGELPEPVGWTFQHEETGLMDTLANDGINNPENFTKNNPRHVFCEALFSEKQMRAALRRPVVVDEAMVERACVAACNCYGTPWDNPLWDKDGHRQRLRKQMQAALNAALEVRNG